jgi:hypothetical protein
MVEITLPIVLQIVQTAGILVGIFYYIMTLRNSTKARQRELIHQKAQIQSLDYTRTFWELATWTDWETVEEFQEKYGMPNNPEAQAKFSHMMRHYSLAGTLLKENMANADLIFQLYPVLAVIELWEQFEAVILNVREKRNSPTHLDGFEFLYREAKKRHPEILPRSHVWS